MEKITLQYFTVNDKITFGRGKNIKLLLVYDGLDHEYIRVPITAEDWFPLKAQLIENGFYTATLPVIKIENKVYGKAVPIMRYLSTKLEYKYHGSNDEENFALDMMTDVLNDWFEDGKKAIFGDEEAKQNYLETQKSKWYEMFEKYYQQSAKGPYILGDKITYIDFMVYHLIDDEDSIPTLGNCPNIKLFVEEFEKCPKIKEYLDNLK
ncbi:unnamed protein product [Rhizopus stolonifer]